MPIPKPLHSVISALHWVNHNKVAGAIIDEMAEEIKKDKEAERQKRANAAETKASNGRRKLSERPEGPSTSKKLMGRIEGCISGEPHSLPHAPTAPHAEGDVAQGPENEEGREDRGEGRGRKHRHHPASGGYSDEQEHVRSHRHHRHRQEDGHRPHPRRRHRDEQPERGAGLTAERLALMTGGRRSPLSEPLESRRRDMTNGQVRDESSKKRSAKDEDLGKRKKQQPPEKPKFGWRKGIGAYIAERAAWKAEQRKRTQLGRTGRRSLEDPREAEWPRRRKHDNEDERRRESSPHRHGDQRHHSPREASPPPEQRSHHRHMSGTAVPAPPVQSKPAEYVYIPPASSPPKAVHPLYPEGGTSSDSDTLPHSARHTRIGTPPLPGEVRVPIEAVGDAGWRRPRNGLEDRDQRDDGVGRGRRYDSGGGSTGGRVGRRPEGHGRRIVTERERRALYR